MLHEIVIQTKDGSFQTHSFQFPGGELQVQVPCFPEHVEGDISVTARLQSPASLIQLLLLDEILSRTHRSGRRTLVDPYFPYARQDRVMAHNEAFSLKAVSRLVNEMNFDRIVVCDPHSDVTPALIEGVEIIKSSASWSWSRITPSYNPSWAGISPPSSRPMPGLPRKPLRWPSITACRWSPRRRCGM
ncbi:ribose-phosphate pyrophosphokinase-like domain-containing protein [Singulisphaera sp. Ch08]|uniref:Ribose-phosphate pyrophosphokinase-like domain-containing protein n=1 Tax=Singulisphaera sp. Ch08 TaxID=3120278 RepID=A0AAU7CPR2_9BACT